MVGKVRMKLSNNEGYTLWRVLTKPTPTFLLNHICEEIIGIGKTHSDMKVRLYKNSWYPLTTSRVMKFSRSSDGGGG